MKFIIVYSGVQDPQSNEAMAIRFNWDQLIIALMGTATYRPRAVDLPTAYFPAGRARTLHSVFRLRKAEIITLSADGVQNQKVVGQILACAS